jgi:hypothetical protein
MLASHLPASEFHAIGGIHRGLTGQTTGLLEKCASAHRVIIWVFLCESEFWG